MKNSEIRALSDQEMRVELDRLHRQLFEMRSQAVTEKLEDPTLITRAKRDIARVLTIGRERELEASRNEQELGEAK